MHSLFDMDSPLMNGLGKIYDCMMAMAPDMDYDKDGCFSGGAVEMPDGRHLLMYTGVRSVRQRNGKIVNYQTQCIAIGDGVTHEKYGGNPVIRAEEVPEGGSIQDFRDPHIWYENGKYWVVVGNRTPDDSGTILLYKSEDEAFNQIITDTNYISQNELNADESIINFAGADSQSSQGRSQE